MWTLHRRLLRRLSVALGILLLVAALATPAAAHDNLGGDELAMAYWMFVFAVLIAVSGVVILWWGFRSGQFSGIEDPKYRMLDDAPDLDDLPGTMPPASPPASRPAPTTPKEPANPPA